jgi:hypothetical protein
MVSIETNILLPAPPRKAFETVLIGTQSEFHRHIAAVSPHRAA